MGVQLTIIGYFCCAMNKMSDFSVILHLEKLKIE